MHRTEGEDFDSDVYGDATNKRGYTPGSPPTIPATRLPAESMNAIQEEFCNLIELAGGTLAADAAADKTAKWRQVYDLIFQGGKLGTTSLADNGVTLAKLNSNTYTKYKTKTRSTSMLAIGVVSELTMSPGAVNSPFRISLNYVPFLNDSSATVRVAIKYGSTVIANLDLNVQDTTLTSNELDLSLSTTGIYNANGNSDFTVEVVTLSSGCSASDFVFTLEELVHHTEEPTW